MAAPPPDRSDRYPAVIALLERLRPRALERRWPARVVVGLFALVQGCVAIAILATVALFTSNVLIFPSLGPTAYLQYASPLTAQACPRNTILGQAIGVVAGWLALELFGVAELPPVSAAGVSWGRVGASALSLGLTCGVMVWAGVPHAPAASTTLMIALGLVRPRDLPVLMLGVLLLTVWAFIANRVAGVRYPLWNPPPDARTPGWTPL